MKKTPYKICPYSLVKRFVLLQNPKQQLHFIVNLLSYRTHSIITSTAIQQFAQMIVIDETEIYRRMASYKNMDDLITFCVAVNNMYRLGFISQTDLRFMRIAADRHFRNMPTTKSSSEDASEKFSTALIYN